MGCCFSDTNCDKHCDSQERYIVAEPSNTHTTSPPPRYGYNQSSYYGQNDHHHHGHHDYQTYQQPTYYSPVPLYPGQPVKLF